MSSTRVTPYLIKVFSVTPGWNPVFGALLTSGAQTHAHPVGLARLSRLRVVKSENTPSPPLGTVRARLGDGQRFPLWSRRWSARADTQSSLRDIPACPGSCKNYLLLALLTSR